MIVTSADGLIGLAELGVLELHIWGSRVEDIHRPDLVVIDLDPGPGVAFERIKEAAGEVRQRQ